MSMYLKALRGPETPCVESQPHDVYADVTSCHFKHYDLLDQMNDGCGGFAFGQAHIWCREPVKTALVPGFAEIEKRVTLSGPAFLMNENGKTFSIFKPTVEQESLIKALANGGVERARAVEAELLADRQSRREEADSRPLTDIEERYVARRASGMTPGRAAIAAGYYSGASGELNEGLAPIQRALAEAAGSGKQKAVTPDEAYLGLLPPELLGSMREVAMRIADAPHGTVGPIRSDAVKIIEALDRHQRLTLVDA